VYNFRQVTSATYGLLEERKMRWCGPCGRAHGAVGQSKWQDQAKLKVNAARSDQNLVIMYSTQSDYYVNW
jgi:hypothetical protein